MIEDPETYLSWCDDGVTLMCERDECMVYNERVGRKVWFQEVFDDYKLLPETAVMIRAQHIAKHTEDMLQCFYIKTYDEHVGHFMLCRIHDNNSKHPVSEGFDKPCISVDPW